MRRSSHDHKSLRSSASFNNRFSSFHNRSFEVTEVCHWRGMDSSAAAQHESVNSRRRRRDISVCHWHLSTSSNATDHPSYERRICATGAPEKENRRIAVCFHECYLSELHVHANVEARAFRVPSFAIAGISTSKTDCADLRRFSAWNSSRRPPLLARYRQ